MTVSKLIKSLVWFALSFPSLLCNPIPTATALLNVLYFTRSSIRHDCRQRELSLRDQGRDEMDRDGRFGEKASNDKNSTIMDQVYARHESLTIEKLRDALEEANTQGFLKRRPLKLPYVDARRWVQANLGCDTREEFEDLVANGNLRTPYIPKNPESYYRATREWNSWDHFLRGCFDGTNPSAIQPSTGIFD